MGLGEMVSKMANTGSRVLRVWVECRGEEGRRGTSKGRGGGFKWGRSSRTSRSGLLDRFGFIIFFLLLSSFFGRFLLIFGPILQPPTILLFFSLFPPFKPISRIYSKSRSKFKDPIYGLYGRSLAQMQLVGCVCRNSQFSHTFHQMIVGHQGGLPWRQGT